MMTRVQGIICPTDLIRLHRTSDTLLYIDDISAWQDLPRVHSTPIKVEVVMLFDLLNILVSQKHNRVQCTR